MVPEKSYINPGDEDQMEISGYRLNRIKQVVIWIFIVLTIGLLRLVFYWLPHYFLRCTHDKCSLAQAESVIMKVKNINQYEQYFVAKVETATREGTSFVKYPKKYIYPNQTFSFFSFKMISVYVYKLLLFFLQKDENLIHYFISKKVKYIWDGNCNEFRALKGLESDTTCAYLHKSQGLSISEQSKRRILYGVNSIAVHVTPIVVLLFKQVLSPFYIFQAFSMCLWYADEYYIYATCIVVISVFSIVVTIYQIRSMQRALRNTISSTTVVTVCRGNDVYEDIPSEDLVPGDVIEIPRHGCMMQCDAALLGGNCIVNESSLTGESVPITKTPLPNPMTVPGQPELMFDLSNHSRHVLFSGTQVIQTRFYGNQKVRAVVLRTGFITSKGNLVRAILYPKPVDFKFNRDTYKFIGVLACIAVLGFIYTITLMVRKIKSRHIIVRALDLVTIAVPPALPAALAVGVVFAQQRLKKSAIFCISPSNINISGAVNAVCFDKTGTLTEDGLELQGVVPVSKKRFEPEIRNMNDLSKGGLLYAMATCHSLTIIDGELMGDPLDLIMFDAINWKLEEPGQEETRFDMMVPTIVHPFNSPVMHQGSTEMVNNDSSLINHESCNLSLNNLCVDFSFLISKFVSLSCEFGLQGEDIGIVRQFPFSSSLQRMSVIVRTLNSSNFDLYVKGSPEMISQLSQLDSLPDDFHEVLTQYTQYGYRVIAVAWKPLPAKLNYVKVQRIARDQVERELIFLGLLIMENKIKPETSPVINNLQQADIRTIMVTGDNMLTALCVARDCGMVDKGDRIILVQAYPPTELKAEEIEFVYAGDSQKKVEEVITSQVNINLSYQACIKGTVIEIDEDNKRFHFALTGKSWAVLRQYFPDQLLKILVRGTVFARMAPDQKAQLVEGLQALGYYVGMCGDGANDCGALKTAHTGISLSEAEASVASPFTSKKPTIECVPKVISEGRCALVTSFGIFKYMASYSLAQLVSVLILYWNGANLTDPAFLYVDLFLITSLSVTFGYTEPYKELVKDLPLSSLISPGPILSLITQTIIHTSFQTAAYFYVQQQEWYVLFEPFKENEDDDYSSHENSAVFLISAYQYIILAIIYSKGKPFRKTIFSNCKFNFKFLNIFWFVDPSTLFSKCHLKTFFQFIKQFPVIDYRLIFVGLAVANFVISLVFEMFIVDNLVVIKKCKAQCSCCKHDDYEYTHIEKELKEDPSWPPLDQSGLGLAQYIQRLESTNQVILN
ncbi:hypothetical protein LOTGIDRAFT_135940 [Lottia gigantea]|uniref:Cation-transporting ATPase n=1 Tax=Lottia gigantea TaxID=225164 RepID=V4CQ16_LOTGI|nr:hypothetical protein LOTGIDRAFT_135940 [Lottia gigantea]ESP04540.1 hypothetical protein LOTGIDRAFT_135940 [Lottia gigantea]